MATKIKLMRLGKMREPHYRIVVADARTKRDGRSIETIGEYHPKNDPSIIKVDGERAAYWLGVGAQPTEAVAAILKVTGDWQKFKGVPAPPPMKFAAPKPDKLDVFNAALAETSGEPEAEATTPKKRAPKKAVSAEADEARPSGRRRLRAEGRGSQPPQVDEPPKAPASRRERRRGEGGGADVLEEALEHLVRGIVDHPDDVQVDMVDNRRGQRLEVRVHPEDLGRVIGRNGRTAKALRQVINGVGGKGIRVDVVDLARD